MKLGTLQAACGAAALFLSAQPAAATHSHRHAHSRLGKKHTHGHGQSFVELVGAPKAVEKRTTCSLPDHPDLVRIAGADNNGFAMSPDQTCDSGKYCPFACVPGKVMAQWEPNSTYAYPQSMNGGLYCDGGVPKKPFPDSPYCVDGTGAIQATNKCGKVVSFCQTVLPGNEAMLIPTDVSTTEVIAVPGPSYWASTAAHYYINPPGVSSSEGCVWGDPSKPIGNWSPYVAGANTDGSGQTFVKIAWNPIWTGSDLSRTKPSFGVKIECNGGGCNGLPCSIDPSTDGIGGLTSPVSTQGVGGAQFCVVTVPRGESANIVVFNTDGSGGEPDTTSSPPSSSSPPPPATSSSSEPKPSYAKVSSSWSSSFSSGVPALPSSANFPTVLPGVFHENMTHSSGSPVRSSPTVTWPPSSSVTGPAAPAITTSKNDGAADQGGVAIAGLIVALVAAAALY
ncbi:hypothetical protein QBC33DRAFT_581859 [Phialemonium atrogriseum]|uniref:Uncharacterized protein n=1 Tax=Phialemonium atrogriseum TaxID=1093897 RepID=A0AAJ0FIM3_9PEZI|nr:uncharacterized protein QBC33DRAFT_581859 [Phialemonium atrogriseum]KAK1762240.1 hypothetical protein QBC33DRAFT_581859 [Phialemonium atrogriseum]